MLRPPRQRRGIPAWLALLLTLPCAAGEDAGHGERVGFTFMPTRTVLLLIPEEQATQALAQDPPAGIDPASEAESELARDCGGGQSQLAARGLLLEAVAKAWRVVLHPLAVAVRDELLKYVTVSEATASGNYYRGASIRAATAPSGRISCVRFVRFTSLDPGETEVALDFIASVHLDPAHDAIRLRPLRLFIGHAGAKSVNGRYSVALSMSARAVWRDEFAGHEGLVFEHTLATEAVDLRSGSYLKYYPVDAPGTRVPVIPLSAGIDRSRDFGQAEFTVSVAELGVAPATLKLLAEMLPDPDEKVGQLLIVAALSAGGAK
ncbi:MAG: hypothetical protein ACHP9U_04685 [Steroidobacterales bacterium]